MEQRASKRMPIQMSLEVSTLFKQDNVKVSGIHAPIEIQNISKSVIGFVTDSILPIGYYFQERLKFTESGEELNCVVRIVRQDQDEAGRNFYGCEFVGMASVFDYIFDAQEQTTDSINQEKERGNGYENN